MWAQNTFSAVVSKAPSPEQARFRFGLRPAILDQEFRNVIGAIPQQVNIIANASNIPENRAVSMSISMIYFGQISYRNPTPPCRAILFVFDEEAKKDPKAPNDKPGCPSS
jgi:hypothetical protein